MKLDWLLVQIKTKYSWVNWENLNRDWINFLRGETSSVVM